MAMSFSEIQHQPQAVDALQGAMRSNRLPHGFIFCGPSGVGKALTARALGRYLLCEQPVRDERSGLLDACGQCKQCIMVEHGTHPDLSFYSKPVTQALFPIDLITRRDKSPETPTVNESVQLKAMQAARRVTIIDDAELMTDSAANAFLKTFEEAPEGSYLILLVTSLDRLLPTIRSRGRLIRFRALPVEFVARLLVEQGVPQEVPQSLQMEGDEEVEGEEEDEESPAPRRGRQATATQRRGPAPAVEALPVTPEEADVLAHWSQGSIAQARSLAQCRFTELRREILSIIPSLDRVGALDLATAIDKWAAEQADERTQTRVAVEKNTWRRSYMKLALSLLASLFRDALVVVHQGPETLLMNGDVLELVGSISESIAPARLEMIIARLLELQTMVDRNAHAQLLLENACLDVAGVLADSRKKSH